MIDGVLNSGAAPVLERLVQFAGQRQRLIAHNIANFDTPGFQPTEVSPEQFQQQLGEAVDRRRAQFGGAGGALNLRSTTEVSVHGQALTLQPQPIGDNVLFHDQNDRQLESTMQDLVENFYTFRMAAQLMRSHFDLINVAIRERM